MHLQHKFGTCVQKIHRVQGWHLHTTTMFYMIMINTAPVATICAHPACNTVDFFYYSTSVNSPQTSAAAFPAKEKFRIRTISTLSPRMQLTYLSNDYIRTDEDPMDIFFVFFDTDRLLFFLFFSRIPERVLREKHLSPSCVHYNSVVLLAKFSGRYS